MERQKWCKRCEYPGCDKVLREHNKSGLCSFHYCTNFRAEHKKHKKEFNFDIDISDLDLNLGNKTLNMQKHIN